MISADVKANKNKKDKKDLLALYLTNFYEKYLQNLKHNVTRACIFHLILVGVLSISIFYIKNRGDDDYVYNQIISFFCNLLDGYVTIHDTIFKKLGTGFFFGVNYQFD